MSVARNRREMALVLRRVDKAWEIHFGYGRRPCVEESVVWKNIGGEKKLGRKTASYHNDNGRQRCTWDIGDY